MPFASFSVRLQFDAVENGMHTSKMMQVFSKQAPMMDALISHFADQMRRRKLGENGQPPENVVEGKEIALKCTRENMIECVADRISRFINSFQNQTPFKIMAVAF